MFRSFRVFFGYAVVLAAAFLLNIGNQAVSSNESATQTSSFCVADNHACKHVDEPYWF